MMTSDCTIHSLPENCYICSMSKEVYCILMDASSGPGSLACRTVYGDLESAMSDLTEIRKTGLYPEAAVVPMRMVGRDNLPPSARGIMMGSRFNPDYMLGNYGTAVIGGQTWTARNLMAPNSPVHGVFFSHETAETYFTYEAAVAEAFKYPGWHIPTVSDWEELIEFCGGTAEAGRKLKAKRGWGCYANGGTDQYRFGAARRGTGTGSSASPAGTPISGCPAEGMPATPAMSRWTPARVPGCTRLPAAAGWPTRSVWSATGSSPN